MAAVSPPENVFIRFRIGHDQQAGIGIIKGTKLRHDRAYRLINSEARIR
jgi:hypothetical protein